MYGLFFNHEKSRLATTRTKTALVRNPEKMRVQHLWVVHFGYTHVMTMIAFENKYTKKSRTFLLGSLLTFNNPY
jgi:hypothetical protein